MRLAAHAQRRVIVVWGTSLLYVRAGGDTHLYTCRAQGAPTWLPTVKCGGSSPCTWGKGGGRMTAAFTCGVCQSSLASMVAARGSEPAHIIFGRRVTLAFDQDGRCIAVCGTSGGIVSLVMTGDACRRLQDAWRRAGRRPLDEQLS